MLLLHCIFRYIFLLNKLVLFFYFGGVGSDAVSDQDQITAKMISLTIDDVKVCLHDVKEDNLTKGDENHFTGSRTSIPEIYKSFIIDATNGLMSPSHAHTIVKSSILEFAKYKKDVNDAIEKYDTGSNDSLAQERKRFSNDPDISFASKKRQRRVCRNCYQLEFHDFRNCPLKHEME